MKRRTLAASLITCLAALALGGVGALGSGCELLVQLDRDLPDTGTEDAFRPGVCPICASPEDASAEAAPDASAAIDAAEAGAIDAGGGTG